jgi:ABC-type polysaccharide/polyol phosphate transport system ATPase subunit
MTAASSSSSEAGGAPIVELRDVGVWYRREHVSSRSLRDRILGVGGRGRPDVRWALRNVDLTCREGESWGIVGRNGAGKSTLCLLLADILTADEGRVAIRGKVSTLVTLGAAFQPDLSGRDNVLLHAAFVGTPRATIEAKMDEIVEFSGLQEFIDEPMRGYSTGMRARLGFAVATSLDPEVLILDEVLSVGDAEFRAKCEAKMEALMARSKCILTVSHSTSFLRKVTTHCVWLERGTVVRSGPSHAVLKEYELALAHAGGGPPPAEGA